VFKAWRRDAPNMKILEVVEACDAGVGRHVRGLCQDLIAQNHQLTVAYAPHRADETFKEFIADHRDRIRFVQLGVERGISPVSDLRAIILLLRLIKGEGPFDIVHGHSSKGGALARIAGRCIGTPTIYTPNGLIMASLEISRIEAKVYTLIEYALGHWATSKLIAVSEGESELILKLRLVREDRVAIVENGIDDQDFEYFSEGFNREDTRQRPLTFGSIMRFTPQKAPGHLIEAFARLVDMSPSVPLRLVVAGDGELFAEAEKQVASTELGENVSLLGWRTDVREVLSDLDVFVVSSLYEGLSYSTMEAMAAKLPVVSTNVFGTKETVARVPGNVLVPVGDPQALALGMYQLTIPTEYGSVRRSLQRIGQANHDYVRARLRQSEVTRRTLEIYQALCQ
jgi:glycosyltransferase involved in cell wall biosynthesis